MRVGSPPQHPNFNRLMCVSNDNSLDEKDDEDSDPDNIQFKLATEDSDMPPSSWQMIKAFIKFRSKLWLKLCLKHLMWPLLQAFASSRTWRSKSSSSRRVAVKNLSSQPLAWTVPRCSRVRAMHPAYHEAFRDIVQTLKRPFSWTTRQGHRLLAAYSIRMEIVWSTRQLNRRNLSQAPSRAIGGASIAWWITGLRIVRYLAMGLRLWCRCS